MITLIMFRKRVSAQTKSILHKLTIVLGRNFLLRIQMLHIIRDRIVPTDWEKAKVLEIPKVTGSPPAKWWGEDEDRDLLLGICKHGYQQYLDIRNDPEFCFYGKKYDDSQAGPLEDDDAANDKGDDVDSRQNSVEPVKPPANVIAKKTYNKKDDDDSDYNDNAIEEPEDEDDEYLGKQKVYVWPSKADIGMRLRRIIAAFLRERATTGRRRKDGAPTRGRSGNTRAGSRRKAAAGEFSNRSSKRSKNDYDGLPVTDVPVEDLPVEDMPVEGLPVDDLPVDNNNVPVDNNLPAVEGMSVENMLVNDLPPVENLPVENLQPVESHVENLPVENMPVEGDDGMIQ